MEQRVGKAGICTECMAEKEAHVSDVSDALQASVDIVYLCSFSNFFSLVAPETD